MKKLIALLLTLSLVLSTAACGTSEDIASAESVAQPANTSSSEESPDVEEGAASSTPTVADNGLEAEIEEYVESVLENLNKEYESIIEGVDSYSTYIGKKDEVIALYEKINTTSASLCIKMCSYAIACAENILDSGKSVDDMYDDMEIIYDLIYDDMGDEIYDRIYDGILDDIYNDLYDGALDDLPDGVEYSDWSDARSAEYEMWSNTRSETYEQWSDFRSDVYEFGSNMRSELWDDDLDGAYDELEDFREDVAKMAGEETPVSSETKSEESVDDSSVDGIRPEFKEAMDSYEEFFDEYVAFMKSYMDSDDPLSMMTEYTQMMEKFVKTMSKLEEIDEEELSDAEALYYADVMLRINQKLLEVS